MRFSLVSCQDVELQKPLFILRQFIGKVFGKKSGFICRFGESF